MNTLPLLLTLRVSNMTSALTQTCLIRFDGWNKPFHYVTLLIFFLLILLLSLHTNCDADFEEDCLGNVYIDSFATCILSANHEQVNIHDVAFDQQHLLLDQGQDLFNKLSKHKKYLMASLESTLIRRYTLTSNFLKRIWI